MERRKTKWSLILTDKVMVQLQSLCVHAQKGCLSDIEASGGTGRNEALHRHVNPHFSHAGRIGIPLAYALLSVLLYTHNLKKVKPNYSLTRLIALCAELHHGEQSIP